MRAESYLSPETLSQLAPFDLRARMIVEGIRSGSHTSPLRGMSVEFEQHRPYVPGDDLRHLDWKVYGRSDRLAIKQYEQETTLDVILLVDCSASMKFGTLGVRVDGVVPVQAKKQVHGQNSTTQQQQQQRLPGCVCSNQTE